MQAPVYLHIIKVDIKQWTKACLNCQNPGIRRISPYFNVSLWGSLSFLRVNQQKRAGMVSTNNM